MQAKLHNDWIFWEKILKLLALNIKHNLKWHLQKSIDQKMGITFQRQILFVSARRGGSSGVMTPFRGPNLVPLGM